MSVWTDLKERLLKFETLHGLYFVPLGIIGLFVVALHIEYVIHVLAALVFIYAIVEGLYKVIHNPIKKQAAIDAAGKKYINPPTPPTPTPPTPPGGAT